jgi:hypothetical protein
MNLEQGFDFNAAHQVADKALLGKGGKPLSDREVDVLRGAWRNQTYEEIAENMGYSSEYIKGDIGKNLWDRLSAALGEKVSKSNFQEALKRRSYSSVASAPAPSFKPLTSHLNPDNGSLPSLLADPEFPEGQVALDSAYYVERSPIESHCYKEILQPGALIRIKAPKLMGKTSLMTRILAQAINQGYRAVDLNLLEADEGILTDLDKFLRWFCYRVGRKLQLENQLDNYWDEKLLSSNSNCTDYFEEYLLAQIGSPLVLGLDEVDRVFLYPHIAQDFFGLLRTWHEKAKNLDIWKHLRLVVVHSTEVYIPLNINQSPFNVGLPAELPEFSSEQVQDLAQRHGLNWASTQVEQVMEMVGGHPYLVRVALYSIRRQELVLEQLLQTAPTEAGIFSSHLRRHLENFQEDLELAAAFKKVVSADSLVRLESMQLFKLQSMGLVQLEDNEVMPRCKLYREYFRDRL